MPTTNTTPTTSHLPQPMLLLSPRQTLYTYTDTTTCKLCGRSATSLLLLCPP